MSTWDKTDPKNTAKALAQIEKLHNENILLLESARFNKRKRDKFLMRLRKNETRLTEIAKSAASIEVSCRAIDAFRLSEMYTSDSSIEGIALGAREPLVREYAVKKLDTIFLLRILKERPDASLCVLVVDELISEKNLASMRIRHERGRRTSTYGQELLDIMSDDPERYHECWSKVLGCLSTFKTIHTDNTRHADSDGTASSDCHFDGPSHYDYTGGRDLFRLPPYPFDD